MSTTCGSDGSTASLDLKGLAPDYEVAGVLFMKGHCDGGFILRIEARPWT